MAYANFLPNQPSGGSIYSSSTIRNNFNALYQGCFNALKVEATDPPSLQVYVNPSDVENFYNQVWIKQEEPLNFGGGTSPAIIPPTSNPRIALLTIDYEGNLEWIYGSESASPSPPNSTSNKIPLAYVYEKVGMTEIVNYEDRTSYPSGGYIYKDVRPLLVSKDYPEDVKSILQDYDTNGNDLIDDTELLTIIDDWGDKKVSDKVMNVARYVWEKMASISGLPDSLDVDGYNIFGAQTGKYNAVFLGGNGTVFEAATTFKDQSTFNSKAIFDYEIDSNGRINYKIDTITSNTTLSSHNYILANASSGNITITLPDATTCQGRGYIIKKIDSSSNTITIDGNGSQTIDGSLTQTLSTQYEVIRIISDGNNWYKW